MTPSPYKIGDRVTIIDGLFKGQTVIVRSVRWNGFTGSWVVQTTTLNKDGIEIVLKLRERDVAGAI